MVAFALGCILVASQTPAHSGRAWKARFAPRIGTVDRLALSTDVAVSAKLPLVGGPEAHLVLRMETTRRAAARSGRRGRGTTTIELTVDRIAFEFDLAGDTTRYDSAADPGGNAGRQEVVRRYAGLLLGRTLSVDVLPTGRVIRVGGVDDLYADLERVAGEGSPLAGVLDALTRDLGAVALAAILQQATPVFPGGKLRPGDTWSRSEDLQHPLFERMHSATEYAFRSKGRHAGRRAALTEATIALHPEGQGPLLDSLRALAGIEGEVRLEDGEALGNSAIWSDARTGQTLSLLAEQRVRATLSVPVSVLGFTRRTRLPLKLDQRVTLERIAPGQP